MNRRTGGTVLRTVRAAAVVKNSTDRELLVRFTAGDQSAFAALVSRHAAMVLGVCRRALPIVQDAEDACQATFLVLARRAKEGRWHASVANWLFTTARRIASRANRAAVRRAKREAQASPHAIASTLDQITGREAFALLDEELYRLPTVYREPLVLCYLEGLTRDEAAIRLGVPTPTLKDRLDRARKKLGAALTRRGVELGVGLLAGAVATLAEAAPPKLVAAVLNSATGRAPGTICQLAEGMAANGALSKVGRMLVALVGVVGLGVSLGSIGANPEGGADGVAVVQNESSAYEPKPISARPELQLHPAGKSGEKTDTTITYIGRVLGPDGKPVAGAKLHVSRWPGNPQPVPAPERATADAEGRFEFQVSKEPFMDVMPVIVGATAATHGAGWVQLKPNSRTDDLTIRMVRDDAPITGQIVTLEGKPVPGAFLSIQEIYTTPKEDLGPWLAAVKEAVKAKKDQVDNLEFEHLTRFTVGMSPRVTTDAEGRFKLSGIGAERLVILRVEGPTIATQHLRVLTRAGEALTALRWEADPQYNRPASYLTYYGANFRYPAAPTKPIVGVVHDADTKKPLVGVTVRSHKFADVKNLFGDERVVQTTTDKDGRYRLVGMPCGEGNGIVVVPGRDHPYLLSARSVLNSAGLEPVAVDFALKRGIWIEGKITDKVTGQPVWAAVDYYALDSNPNLRDQRGFERVPGTGLSTVETRADGSYRIAGLPGGGFIVVSATLDHLRATERDDEFGMSERRLNTVPDPLELLRNYSAIAAVEPKAGVASAKQDLTLDPGWTCKVTVLGPDGTPLTGTRGYGVSAYPRETDPNATAEYIVHALNPRQPRIVIFRHQERGLVGVMPPPKKNGDSLRVEMRPGATITGRLLGTDGKPRAEAELQIVVRTNQKAEWEYHLYANVRTDKEGRFRVEGLFPGLQYRLSDDKGDLQFGEGLRSGEVKELGDVRQKLEE
jgi:RNA polymerase sigma factor (sigma-70 family)